MRNFFLEPHDALMDACSVVENIKGRLARVGEVAVDVGRRHEIARLVGEERFPFIELPPVEQVGLVEQEALYPVLEQHRVDVRLAGHAPTSWIRRSHSFQKQRIWSSSS